MMSRSVLVRMRNVSDKSFRENQNTHFVLNNSSVCEIMWENMVQQDTSQMAVRRMRCLCWRTKATHTRTHTHTHTHTQHVILPAFSTPTMVTRAGFDILLIRTHSACGVIFQVAGPHTLF